MLFLLLLAFFAHCPKQVLEYREWRRKELTYREFTITITKNAIEIAPRPDSEFDLLAIKFFLIQEFCDGNLLISFKSMLSICVHIEHEQIAKKLTLY